MSSMTEARIVWRDNPLWHQLLGLCPALAVTMSADGVMS